jgi:hypothetical protein
VSSKSQNGEPNELLERILGAALRGVMLEYEPEIDRFIQGLNKILAKSKKPGPYQSANRQSKIGKRKSGMPPARITRVEKV